MSITNNISTFGAVRDWVTSKLSVAISVPIVPPPGGGSIPVGELFEKVLRFPSLQPSPIVTRHIKQTKEKEIPGYFFYFFHDSPIKLILQ